MSSQENISTVRKLFDLYNKNETNQSGLDQIFSSTLTIHDPAIPNAKEGIQALKQAQNNYVKAFPNKKNKIDNIFGTEDLVTVYSTVTGTHKGQFQGIPATNRDFKITGISIYRFSNGKITELWQNWDRLGLLEQIGEVHPAHASY